MSKVLPFDEKNEKDFLRMTQRIRVALEKIAKDPRIKPTKSSLARLSGVHRNTLYNRSIATSSDVNPDNGWPFCELARIKKQREEGKAHVAEKASSNQAHELDEVRKMLRKSRHVVSHWFHRAIELKRDRDHARRQIELLLKQLDECKKDVGRLRAQATKTLRVIK